MKNVLILCQIAVVLMLPHIWGNHKLSYKNNQKLKLKIK